ncbi:protealysin inhibitor emfourin [Oxalobacteraceae bacterium A2-2]
MKIHATVEGGLAGLTQHYDIDTAAIPYGAALEAALADPALFLAVAAPAPAVGADLQRWTIQVENGLPRSASFTADGNPQHRRWEPVLNLIQAAAP